jgi:phage tail-like protein
VTVVPNSLIDNDPIIAQNFFLEIDGEVVSMLSSVSGLDVEMDVATMQQVGKDGKSVIVKTLAGRNKPPDLSLVRMAAVDSTSDKLWSWFKDIESKGILLSDRTNNRKNGSIVMYDSTHKEIARFNFTNGWPSKISTDQLSVDSNDPVKETITLVCERLERVK